MLFALALIAWIGALLTILGSDVAVIDGLTDGETVAVWWALALLAHIGAMLDRLADRGLR